MKQPSIKNITPVKNPTSYISFGKVNIPTPIVILIQKIITPLNDPLFIGRKILCKKFIFLTLFSLFISLSLGLLKLNSFFFCTRLSIKSS